jgi:hypothetical protein
MWDIIDGAYCVCNQLRCPTGDCALLDNDGTFTGVLCDDCGDGLESSHVGSDASADTAILGRCVDGNEDDVGLANVLSNICGKEEVAHATRDTCDGSAIRHFAAGADRAGVRAGIDREGCVTATIAGNADNVVQSGLVDRRVVRVPASDASLIAVHDGDADVRILESNHGCGRST